MSRPSAHDRGGFLVQTPLQTSTPRGLDWRLLNPALRVSKLKYVLGAVGSMPKILRDTQQDCGKPGCLNDNRIQVLARGDEMIEQERRLPPSPLTNSSLAHFAKI
jgi:hypothetical protein